MKKLIYLLSLSVVLSLPASAQSTTDEFNAGLELYSKAEYGAALDHFNNVLKLDPKDVNALYNKGLCLYNMKLYESAIKEFENLLLIKKDDPDAWFYKGKSLSKIKNWTQAELAFTMAITYSPEMTKVYA